LTIDQASDARFLRILKLPSEADSRRKPANRTARRNRRRAAMKSCAGIRTVEIMMIKRGL
jgi:hypothetical protein